MRSARERPSFGLPQQSANGQPLCSLLSPTATSTPARSPVAGSHPDGAQGQMCYRRLLRQLSQSPPGCMRRTSLTDGTALGAPSELLPIYVAVVPALQARVQAITRRIRALGAPDVTLVECANADDVATLSLRERRCLHPMSEATEWDVNASLLHSSHGTLSLAVKHLLAYDSLLARRLPAALFLEDDAKVPPRLWRQLRPYHVPCDFDLFWLSAYRENLGVFALGLPERKRPAFLNASGASPAVYRRDPSRGPWILSTAGYIFSARSAATMLSQPVRAPTDISLALLRRAGCLSCATRTRRGSCAIRVAKPCGFVTPPNQYGPKSWLFGQDMTELKQESHKQAS